MRQAPAAAVPGPCFCECRATDCRGLVFSSSGAAGGVRGKTLVQKLEMLPAAAQVGRLLCILSASVVAVTSGRVRGPLESNCVHLSTRVFLRHYACVC